MDPLIDSVVSRLLATDPDAQLFGRQKLERLVQLIELLRVERPHRDRLMSEKALADYLRVPPNELKAILEARPGLQAAIKTKRECYYRAHDVFRWLDSTALREVPDG